VRFAAPLEKLTPAASEAFASASSSAMRSLGYYGANTILAAEAKRQGVPLQNLTTLLGAISPMAQAFGTQNGTSSGSKTESGAQQFGQIAAGAKNLVDPLKYIFGQGARARRRGKSGFAALALDTTKTGD
jgi:hypothetical protein